LVFIALWSSGSLFGDHPVLGSIFKATFFSVVLILLIRFGLLALMVALCTHEVLLVLPLTTHLSAWYAEPTIFVLCLMLAVAIFGFYTSTAGKQLFGGVSLDA
jgi:hypothetical protein